MTEDPFAWRPTATEFVVFRAADLPKRNLFRGCMADDEVKFAASPLAKVRWRLQRRPGRPCCYFHGIDWLIAADHALGVLAECGGRADLDTIVDAVDRRNLGEMGSWVYSLFDDPLMIGFDDDDGVSGWINGQHRSQAMIDAGCKVVIIARDLYEDDLDEGIKKDPPAAGGYTGGVGMEV